MAKYIKSVAILLATYNGEKFLLEQLDSIECQTHTNWHVYASDDGSSDKTLHILEKYRTKWGVNKLSIINSPQLGHAENFMSLIRNLNIKADYYAFCDQDDLWLCEKLERSIRILEKIGEKKPALYGSRTKLINEKGCVIGFSPLFRYEPHLKNALVQSLFGGNTILFNNHARECLLRIAPEHKIIAHDWLLYLLVSACDGFIYYDFLPSILYRQHEANIIGSNNSISDRLARIKLLIKGRFKEYTENNLISLSYMRTILPVKNKIVIEEFKSMRSKSLFVRICKFKKLGLYRQTKLGTFGLWVAIILNKI